MIKVYSKDVGFLLTKTKQLKMGGNMENADQEKIIERIKTLIEKESTNPDSNTNSLSQRRCEILHTIKQIANTLRRIEGILNEQLSLTKTPDRLPCLGGKVKK